MAKKIYLAGPWFHDDDWPMVQKPFNPDNDQSKRLDYLREQLENAGYGVYFPKDTKLEPTAGQDWRETAFKGNIDAIHDADIVFAVTDGKDVGTMMEIGVGYEAGKKLVMFAETLGDAKFNLMLAVPASMVITSRDQLEDLLTKIDRKTKLDKYLDGDEGFIFKGAIE